MNIDTLILVGLPSLLVACWLLAIAREWFIRRRLAREMEAGLAQRWDSPSVWTAEDERRWRHLGELNLLDKEY